MSEVRYVKYYTHVEGEEKHILDTVMVNTGFSLWSFFFSSIYIGIKSRSWKMFFLTAVGNFLASAVFGVILGNAAFIFNLSLCVAYGFAGHGFITKELENQGYVKE